MKSPTTIEKNTKLTDFSRYGWNLNYRLATSKQNVS